MKSHDATTEEYKEKIFSGMFFGPAIKFGFSELGSVEDEVVLDIGCGIGSNTALFAMSGAKVLGVDVNELSLKAAINQSKDLRVQNHCLFIKSKSEALPIPDDSIDIIFSKSTIQYMDRARALEEYYRVLKPEGSIVLIENRPSNPLIKLYRLHREVFKNSAEQIAYKETIRGYITPTELAGFSAKFTVSMEKSYHLFRMISIYARLKNNGVLIRSIDRGFWMLDELIFSICPPARKCSWYVALICRKKTNV